MTDETLPLAELLAKAGDGDFLRSVAEAVVQLLMETDVDGLIGAGRHERSGDRTTYRNCTAPGFLDTRLLLSGGPHDGLVPRCSGIARTAQAVLLDQPLGVVAGDEVADGVTDLVDGLVDPAMHDLLLEGAEEPLDDAIRLGLADERIAGGHAPEADLVVEMFGEERAAVVVSQRHAAGGAGADVAEDIADRHADGLDGGVAIAAFGDVPAERLGVPVLDRRRTARPCRPGR